MEHSSTLNISSNVIPFDWPTLNTIINSIAPHIAFHKNSDMYIRNSVPLK